MKQKLISTIILTIILLSISLTALALTNSNKKACIIYDNLKNSDLSDLLPLATNAYNIRGYATSLYLNPSATNLFSNYESNNAQLYFAHGGYAKLKNVNTNEYTNENVILFPSSYAALTTGNSGTYQVYDPKTDEYIGRFIAKSINNVNLSNTRLITLGVCKSAGNGTIEFNSLAAKMWMNKADMVVGWYEDVQTKSLVKWLEWYHTELSRGTTVSDAIKKANEQGGYIWGSNVQKCHLFANNVGALSTSELEAMNIEPSIDIKKNNYLNLDNINSRKVNDIENIVKLKDANFDERNYKKEEVEGMYMCNSDGIVRHISSYINYYLKVGNYVTNSGYTVSLDENGNIQSITDNTIPEASSKLKNLANVLAEVMK